MRKFLSILMACCFFLPVINAQTVGEQSSFEKMKKKLLKSNEVKKIINGYKKAGFELIGPGNLDVKVLRYIARRDSLGDNGSEFKGVVRCKAKQLGLQLAKHSVAQEYSQRAVSKLKGHYIFDLIEGYIVDEKLEKCYAAYERVLEKKIIEILEPSYSVVRTLPDGSNEFQSIFLIDEREARKLRKSAIEAAIEESGVDEEYINLLKTEVETIVNTCIRQ